MKDQLEYLAKVYSYLYIYKLFLENFFKPSKYYVFDFNQELNSLWQFTPFLALYFEFKRGKKVMGEE